MYRYFYALFAQTFVLEKYWKYIFLFFFFFWNFMSTAYNETYSYFIQYFSFLKYWKLIHITMNVWERPVWHWEEKSISLSSLQQIQELGNLDSLDKIQAGFKTWSFSFELNSATSVSEVVMTSTRPSSKRLNDREEEVQLNSCFLNKEELQIIVPENNNNNKKTVFVPITNKN